jgi:hypothetical protein
MSTEEDAMLLGDIIAQLDDETFAMEALVGLGDLALLAKVEGAAEAEGITPGDFAARAVQAFSDGASDEDWVSLIGVMGRTSDPGQVCLRKMVEFALRPATGAPHACGHHH